MGYYKVKRRAWENTSIEDHAYVGINVHDVHSRLLRSSQLLLLFCTWYCSQIDTTQLCIVFGWHRVVSVWGARPLYR